MHVSWAPSAATGARRRVRTVGAPRVRGTAPAARHRQLRQRRPGLRQPGGVGADAGEHGGRHLAAVLRAVAGDADDVADPAQLRDERAAAVALARGGVGAVAQPRARGDLAPVVEEVEVRAAHAVELVHRHGAQVAVRVAHRVGVAPPAVERERKRAAAAHRGGQGRGADVGVGAEVEWDDRAHHRDVVVEQEPGVGGVDADRLHRHDPAPREGLAEVVGVGVEQQVERAAADGAVRRSQQQPRRDRRHRAQSHVGLGVGRHEDAGAGPTAP